MNNTFLEKVTSLGAIQALIEEAIPVNLCLHGSDNVLCRIYGEDKEFLIIKTEPVPGESVNDPVMGLIPKKSIKSIMFVS